MSQPKVKLAKSKMPDGRQVTVKDHLNKVSELARTYGEHIGLGEQAWFAGMLHDFGKYGDLFQDLLSGDVSRIDHAFPGAVLLYHGTGDWKHIAECIAGHHEGLQWFGMLQPYLKACLRGSFDVLSPMPKGRVPSLLGMEQFKMAKEDYLSDGFEAPDKSLGDMPFDGTGLQKILSYMLSSRMLLSCLVDADYSVSAWEESLDDDLLCEHDGLGIGSAITRLESMRVSVGFGSDIDKKLMQMRNTVYCDCADAAKMGHHLMTLTAPTGSGKTFGMFRYALGRMESDKSIRRAIFVLPYLSLTDQIASQAREIFGDVLVDTSTENNPDRIVAKRWDAPCIVTTTVQFFQSLFSSYPGDVRKLHRLGNAVVVFDEVQALPEDLLRVCLLALKDLSVLYGSHILLSTATPPGYPFIPGLDLGATEVIQDVDGLFSMCERTGVQMGGKLSLEGASEALRGCQNGCVITNLKKHALIVYEALKAVSGASGAYLVSTDLCPDHRRAVIQEIQERLSDGDPVYVSATQCLEAGVDLDFEKIYRVLAPFPALVQSAGRQNRNSKRAKSDITVFEPVLDDSKSFYPDKAYGRQAGIVKEMASAGVSLDVRNVGEYYKRLFRDYGEPEKLACAIRDHDYTGFAKHSALIPKRGVQVVVPYDMILYQDFYQKVVNKTLKKRDLPLVAVICVQCYDMDAVQACCMEAVICRWHDGESYDIPTGMWVLMPECKDCYDSKTGLHLEVPTFIL